MINILGKRYLFFGVSLMIIIPGLILAAMGLPFSIDFTGGSYLEVRFESGNTPPHADVELLYNEYGIQDVQIQSKEGGIIVARSEFLDDEIRSGIESGLESRFNDEVTVLRFESVGPTVGREVALRAGGAVAVAALAVVIYITFAFRGIPHAFRYGICAIIAMLHDVAVVISLAAIGGRLFGWQIDALFLTALLTVIGFSVQDKIVVFDRIRENTKVHKRLEFEKLVNHSIIQTLQRSINTQLMTVEFMLLALALFGGVTLREFSVILLVGLLSGTYSSIFIAAPALVVWENQEWKRWFGRKTEVPAS
ncbi:MAG: protein translocase subunit SecF [Chloroflexi bacterium]|nr:MAG: protein translocase subunit SecF [Chloroflexota bacterium]